MLQVLDYKTGNWRSGGGSIEEAGKLGTLVSEQVSPIFPWDIDHMPIEAVAIGRNSESWFVSYFLWLLIKSYKKKMAKRSPKAEKRGKLSNRNVSVLCPSSSLLTS